MNSTDVSPSSPLTAAGMPAAGQSPEESRWSENPLKGATSKARRAAGTAASRVKEKAGEIAAEQKDAAARNVERYGSSLHESAKSMEAEDPNIAHFAHRAAEQLEKAASYIRNSDMDRIRLDAENVARRHPALFMGGMLAAGLVLGAVLKASTQSLRENAPDDNAGLPEDQDAQSAAVPETSLSTPEGEPEVLPGEMPSAATPGASAGIL